jgi:hypothetical protein
VIVIVCVIVVAILVAVIVALLFRLGSAEEMGFGAGGPDDSEAAECAGISHTSGTSWSSDEACGDSDEPPA